MPSIENTNPTGTHAIEPAAEPSRTPTPRESASRIKCAVCLHSFARLTDEHLRGHGYTVERYRRTFGCTVNPPRERAHSDLRRGGSDPLASAAAMVADPAFVGGVADAIMHGPLRDRLTLSVTALLEVRSRMHGEAVARLEALNAELHAPWRVERGGTNGAPTPTKDLVLMVQSASIEVSKTEDLYMKAAKLAVDEAKGKDAAKLGIPDGLDHFSGTAEKLPVPADVTPAERESVRQLLSGLSQAIARRRARGAAVIDVTSTPVQSVPVVSAPMTVIGPVNAASVPVVHVATPMREADEPF